MHYFDRFIVGGGKSARLLTLTKPIDGQMNFFVDTTRHVYYQLHMVHPDKYIVIQNFTRDAVMHINKKLLTTLTRAHEMMLKYQDLLGSTPLTEEHHAAFHDIETVIETCKQQLNAKP